MSKPDWRKAPEGATHWDSECNVFCADGIWWIECGEYVGSANRGWGTSRYISRPTEPDTWNGPEYGLPPVGTVCELHNDYGYQLSEHGQSFVGKEVKVQAAFTLDQTQDMVAVNMVAVSAFIGRYDMCACFRADMLRPLRTEEDKAVEEMADILNSVTNGATLDEIKRMARELYCAGYRKEKQ